MVIGYLKKFTLLDLDTISALEIKHNANPGAREAHKALAREVMTLVHGAQACADAVKASELMFGGGLDGITEALFADVVGEVPTRPVAKSRLEGLGTTLTELLVDAGLSASKGQARKDIEGGGISLNNQRVGEAGKLVALSDLLFGRYLLLRKGKRTYAVMDAQG
jgi:tyrosyl-tRNA synthetase